MQANATKTATTQRLQQLLPELFEPIQATGDRYLRFQLDDEWTAAIPLASVREALQLPADRLTLLPNTPDCTLGLVNAFNQVFCAIDLAQLLGVGPLGTPRQYAIIAIRAIATETSCQSGVIEGEPVLGLAVRRVLGVANILPEDVRVPPADLPASLAPHTRGMSAGALLLAVDTLVMAPALTQLS